MRLLYLCVSHHLVLWVLCEAAELPELQLDARDLGHGAVRGPARRVGRTFANVHIRVRDLGRGVEGGHQPGADVFLQTNEKALNKRFVKWVCPTVNFKWTFCYRDNNPHLEIPTFCTTVLWFTYSFFQEQSVSCQVVGTKQASQDTYGAFKQVYINISVKWELWSHPHLRFFKFYQRK